MNIVKDLMGSYFLACMRLRSNYQYFRVVKMMLRHESVFLFMKGRNGDDDGSNSLEIFDLDFFGLYEVAMDELDDLITAASSFCKNRNKPALFYAPRILTCGEIFLGKL